MKTKLSEAEILQKVINEYRHRFGDKPFRMSECAAWAYRNNKLSPKPFDAIKLLTREMSRAARAEYYTDAQGRRVRKKHARRETVLEDGVEKKLVLWDDIETAPPNHMRIALQQRRQGILQDCKQHKTDTDSYNDNNDHGAMLLFDYSFNEDLAEMELDTDYPDSKPEYDEEDDESPSEE